jgi:hypothetical protein
MARITSWCVVSFCFVALAGPALAGRVRQEFGPDEGSVGRFAARRSAELPIPEPGALALFALGGAAVVAAARRSRRS